MRRPSRALVLTLLLAGSIPPVAAGETAAARAYFAGELRAAQPLLERRVAARPDDALAAYRLYFVLRATGADATRREIALARARTSLEARMARKPDPVGLYYLGALPDGEAIPGRAAAVDALLDANLPQPDPGWDAFELSRFLHLVRERERGADALGTVLDAILALGPSAWDGPATVQDVAREVAEACRDRPARLARVDGAFRAAIEARPTVTALRLARATYLRELERDDEAAAEVAAARAAGLDSPAEQVRAAELLLDLGDVAGARAVALRLIGQEPSMRAWRALGRAEQALGLPGQALVSWRRVLALDGGDVAARIGAARALEALDRAAEAEQEYRAGVRSTAEDPGPGRDWARLAYAQFLERHDRLDEALAAVAEGDPDVQPSISVRRLRTRTYWRQGRHDLALAESAAGLAAHPDDAGLLHWRSLAFRDRRTPGDVRRALEANAAACAAEPEMRAYRAVRVGLLWTAGRDDEAVALQRRLLDESAADLDGWLKLGRMLSARPDGLPEAAQVYRRALAHFPEDPILWTRLMEALSILRQREQRLRSSRPSRNPEWSRATVSRWEPRRDPEFGVRTRPRALRGILEA